MHRTGACDEQATCHTKNGTVPSPGMDRHALGNQQRAAPEPKRRRIFILSTGSLKGGIIASDLLTGGVGEGEGAATFGGLPFNNGPFALSFRGRGGGQFAEYGLGGYWGAGLLAGAILGARATNSLGYILAGGGVKHFIGAGEVHPAAQVIGGGSFGGLLVGAVLDYSYGWVGTQGGLFERQLPINGHVIQFGIEVGAAQLR